LGNKSDRITDFVVERGPLNLLGIAELAIAFCLTFLPGGVMSQWNTSRLKSANAVVEQCKVSLPSYNALVAQSPFHQLCSNPSCDRPATQASSFGSFSIYGCDLHPPPKHVSTAYIPIDRGFMTEKDCVSKGKLEILVTLFNWSITIAGFGFMSVGVLVLPGKPSARYGLAMIVVSACAWLLFY
jgi:hypothetical protein